MLSKEQHLENLWRRAAGLPAKYRDDATSTYYQTLASERCLLFERMRADRKVIGFERYGKLGYHEKPVWDRVARIKELICEYERTGNMETLVDIANLSELEFSESVNPNAHFNAKDDKEHTHVKRW